MIGETRTEFLARVGADRSAETRPMYRELMNIFLQRVLGEDSGEPLTVQDQRAVQAALQAQIDRIVADAGFTSVQEMEAAR